MHARLRGSESLLTLYQIINKAWFPLFSSWNSRAMNINVKVAAFTVSEKFNYTKR